MTAFNDASKQFWQYLVGRHAGVQEVLSDDQLRDLAELTGVAGDLVWPGTATGNQPDMGWVSVKDKKYGAKGDGVTDDTAALQSILNSESLIYFPAGDYLVDGLVLNTKTKVRIDMVGRIKRKDNSTRLALLNLYNCSDVVINAFRSDGNAANNLYAGLPVDEAKHDLRIDGSSDVKITLVDSINPSGDGVYVTSSSTRLTLGTVQSKSDAPTGRNTLSIVSGSKIVIGAVVCHGTGYNTMPSGFDIEPNNGQTVTDVVVGAIYSRSSGTGGFTIFGNYPPGAGQYQVERIKIGPVIVLKDAGTNTNACDAPLTGVKNLTIESLLIVQDPTATNQAFSLTDADTVRIYLDIPANYGTLPPTIGATGDVYRLRLTGRIGQSGSHCLNIYRLSDSDIDMTLKNPGSGVLIVKNAIGTSANVRWKGDWRKVTGVAVMQCNGAVEWQVDSDRRDWPTNQLVIGTGAAGVTLKSPLAQAVYTFTAAGQTAWACPTGAKTMRVVAIGAGGGGGSGRRDAAGVIRFGGGGGGSGAKSEVVLDATPYAGGAALTVTVGAAGTGGAAVTADATSGNNGTGGGWSGLGTGAAQNTTIVNANGGVGGSGGTAAAGTGGGGSFGTYQGSTGANGSNGTAVGTPIIAAGTTGGNGGGGAGITAANVAVAGGVGGLVSSSYPSYTAAGAIGSNGVDGVAGAVPSLGAGGSGGGSYNGAAAGNGGNGGAPGGAGGGGGASVNGVNSGAGGNGAAGAVQIIVTY